MVARLGKCHKNYVPGKIFIPDFMAMKSSLCSLFTPSHNDHKLSDLKFSPETSHLKFYEPKTGQMSQKLCPGTMIKTAICGTKSAELESENYF